jgi:hypothetical protein
VSKDARACVILSRARSARVEGRACLAVLSERSESKDGVEKDGIEKDGVEKDGIEKDGIKR